MSEFADTIQLLEAKKAKIEQAIKSLKALEGGDEPYSSLGKDAVIEVLNRPSLDQIREIIRRKGAARLGNLAKELKASKEYINHMVQLNKYHFVFAKRGWIKLAS